MPVLIGCNSVCYVLNVVACLRLSTKTNTYPPLDSNRSGDWFDARFYAFRILSETML